MRALPLEVVGAMATLPFLLRSVLRDLECAYTAEATPQVPIAPLDLWANLLRVCSERDIDVGELPALVRLSKRAVRTRIAAAVRCGCLEQHASGEGRKTVRLTRRGREVARQWQSIEKSGEKRWQERVGIARASRLRACLEKTVGAFPLEHPHYPASYGSADASITGGNGQDWKPVFRTGADSVSGLSISALVAQALVAFAMEYEKTSPVALSLSATVITRIPPAGKLLKELGNSVGVAALARHGFLRLSGERGSLTAFLTAKGRAVSAEYDERIRAVEAAWRDRFGGESVAQLRRALEDVTGAGDDHMPPADDDHAARLSPGLTG